MSMNEHVKFALMCVEVNLTKHILALFSIKGCQYCVKYESLHLVGISCARFKHYKE